MSKKLLFAAALAMLLAVSLSAAPVGVELSLVIDVSGSVDSTEYALQRDGYRDAFKSAAVKSLIASTVGGVAVNVIQFSTSATEVIGWTLLTTAAESDAFGDLMGAMARSGVIGIRTDIIDGVDAAVAALGSNSYEGARRLIDVSGDGPQNEQSCPDDVTSICGLLQASRDAAAAAGITINGLAIGPASLATYYTNNLITPGGFVLNATFDTFGEAIEDKLFTEISGVPEPSTYALMGAGLIALVGLRKRFAK